jgi:cleavage and polyadenylation specificity factor subunit 1
MFWESKIHALTTLSIHYYERDSYKSAFSDSVVPHLLKDHHSRCLILRFYTDTYAVLPLRQPDDDWDDSLPTDLEKPYYPSFVVTGPQLAESLSHILDEAFLHEYREPTIAILYSGAQTSTGLLDHRKDTVALIAITLDLQQRASTTIFSVTDLPYDCYRILALPGPVGGVLILGANQLIHVDQAARCVALGVNLYARHTTEFPMLHRPELKLRLEGAVPVALENDEGDVLLALRDGSFAKVRFVRDGRNVTDIEFEMVEFTSLPGVAIAGFSCAAHLNDERIFLGSTTGDSVLLGYTSATKRLPSTGVRIGMNDTVDDLEDIYKDDAEDEQPSRTGGHSKLKLQLHDSFLSTAPIRDAILTPPALADVPPQVAPLIYSRQLNSGTRG